MLLQQHKVPQVGLVHDIDKVADQRNQANQEIKDHVGHHLQPQVHREASLDLLRLPYELHGEEKTQKIADPGYEPDDSRPSEPHSADAQLQVKAVGLALDRVEHLQVVLGQEPRKLPLSLCSFALVEVEIILGNLLEVWVLLLAYLEDRI